MLRKYAKYMNMGCSMDVEETSFQMYRVFEDFYMGDFYRAIAGQINIMRGSTPMFFTYFKQKIKIT